MSTLTPISTITLSADAASVTFSGIPQTYTDLILVGNYKTQNNNYVLGVRVGNGSVDTAGNYSYTRLLGYSAGPFSGRNSNMVFMAATTASSTSNSICRLNFQNYANTTTNKTMLSRSDNNAAWTEADVGLWRSTSAITTISLAESGDGGSGTFGTGNILSGSTFTLYGIGAGSPKAFGGDEVRTDGTYWYHIYRSSGIFAPVQNLSCDYLVVAGGGAGGSGEVNNNIAGGGGAGGYRTGSGLSLTNGSNYTVTVGAGGTAVTTINTKGGNGSNSVFATITSTGGGGGGGGSGAAAAQIGGSGGGGSLGQAGANGTSGQGNNGGSGASASGGGGGGAGAVGSAGSTTVGGAGGNGSATSITGSSVTYAGGGGGGSDATSGGGAGGTGGGGNGALKNTTNATAGTANTGGGGGAGCAGSSANQWGANGGSGIVVVRYLVA